MSARLAYALSCLLALTMVSTAEPRKVERDLLTRKWFNGRVKVIRADRPRGFGARPESQVDPEHERAAIDAVIHETFGRALKDWEVAALVGAPDGATVTLRRERGVKGLSIETKHPFYEKSELRNVYRSSEDKLVVGHRLFVLKKDRDVVPRGFGSRVLAHGVAMAKQLGVAYLTTYAAAGDGYVGYKVWPRLGFNSVDTGFWANLFHPREELLQKIARKGGFKWWDAHAKPGNMWLTLGDATTSMRQHRSYLDAHGIVIDVDAYRSL